MKLVTTTSAAALIAATSMANADGLAEPIMTMEPMEVMEAAAPSSSSTDLIVPLILIALLAVALSSGGEEAVVLVSDASVKTDITPVGTAANGLTIYQYSYTGSALVFEGVMAQDVLMHTPAAVVTYPSGMMAVNYDMIGVMPRVIN
jgi:hypothetical protein